MTYSCVLKRCFTFIYTLLAIIPASSQKVYRVGYKELRAVDSSRHYKPNCNNSNQLFYRPLEIDLWYPSSSNSTDSVLTYGYFLSLFEKRANSFQDSIKYNGISIEMIRQFSSEDNNFAKKILNGEVRTHSSLNAPKANSKFPLLIYMCAYNGMSYENVALFEHLATHGYIIACISSIGRYPGNMTTKYPDVLEQLKDAAFAQKLITKEESNFENVGVFGWSYGGLASTLYASEHQNVKAALSLDGSEYHAYGNDLKEDSDFDSLRLIQLTKPKKFNFAYEYLSNDEVPEEVDSLVHLYRDSTDHRTFLRVNKAQHEDFSCLNSLKRNENPPYEVIKALCLNFFDQHLKGQELVYEKAVSYDIDNGKLYRVSYAESKYKHSKRTSITGKVSSSTDNKGISFATIGIVGGHSGTVADSNGRFSLSIDLSSDLNIRVSSIGYQSVTYTPGQLALILKNGPLLLKEIPNTLTEVLVTAKKPRIRTVGNSGKSKFFNIGFPMRKKGSQVGILLSIGKKAALLRSFTFNIAYSRVDTGTLRINIYTMEKGNPMLNVINQNIFVQIGRKTGLYQVNLLPYHIILKGDVLISLESISSQSRNDHLIYFSAGMFSSSFHRYDAEGNWKKVRGLGTAFNLSIQDVN